MTSTLEAEAIKRKERLAQLKRKATESSDTQEETKLSSGASRPQFRNYKPTDDSLKENVMERLKPENIDEHIAEQLDSAKSLTVLDEVDLTTLAPRKIDWDLKRDIEKKLEKLERRTTRAIAELIRERLASGDVGEDLLAKVNFSAKAAAEAAIDDDSDEGED